MPKYLFRSNERFLLSLVVSKLTNQGGSGWVKRNKSKAFSFDKQKHTSNLRKTEIINFSWSCCTACRISTGVYNSRQNVISLVFGTYVRSAYFLSNHVLDFHDIYHSKTRLVRPELAIFLSIFCLGEVSTALCDFTDTKEKNTFI